MSDSSQRYVHGQGKNPVIVIDMGAQYAQLIARRVREAQCYSELMPSSATAQEILSRDPSAIIISGGPKSVNEKNAPRLDPAIFSTGVPMLGICYGFQLMADELGGSVVRTGLREYGNTQAHVLTPSSKASRTHYLSDEVSQSSRSEVHSSQETYSTKLLAHMPREHNVWMSHGDAVKDVPPDFFVTASTEKTPVAAFESPSRHFYGVQWHPEVQHSPFGQKVIENFLYDCAGLSPHWTSQTIIDSQVREIRQRVGSAHVICGLSGGVDSSVAAALVHRAIGDQLTCIFVDHGLLREGEREQVEHQYASSMGIKVVSVDASSQFLHALDGITEPEQKRKIIGREFIEVFRRAQRQVVDEIHDKNMHEGARVKFLVQGTLYPDVVESGGGSGSATIKSHHNVGGLPKDLDFELIEPLRWLFKDEVRRIGRELGVPEAIVARQPFPGPGLAIRIIGDVTKEKLRIIRAADAIVREELTRAELDEKIWQCPVVLLSDVHSVGVQGDGRTYGHPVVLRPVCSQDAMTADWYRLPYDVLEKISTRITNNVAEVNRVVMDVTSKPPATIEWE